MPATGASRATPQPANTHSSTQPLFHLPDVLEVHFPEASCLITNHPLHARKMKLLLNLGNSAKALPGDSKLQQTPLQRVFAHSLDQFRFATLSQVTPAQIVKIRASLCQEYKLVKTFKVQGELMI